MEAPAAAPVIPSQLDQSDIFKGSKTFSLASLFFSESQKLAAWQLYSWCRRVDDEVDLAPTQNAALDRLAVIESYTRNETDERVSKNLHALVRRYRIPLQYPLDLLEGLRFDCQYSQPQSEDELDHYGYCVAGTVGLMMCHIMGVRDPGAQTPAIRLGQAMQFTNIVRDLFEDFGRGHVYLPRQWLDAEGIEAKGLFSSDEKVLVLRQRLLDRAESYYKEGLRGLIYLPPRAQLAVGMAALLYREIGRRAARGGTRTLRIRTVVPFVTKLKIVGVFCLQWFWKVKIKKSVFLPA